MIVMPSSDINHLIMWNVSNIAKFEVINNHIFLLEFYVVATTCNSLVFVWLSWSAIAFPNPAFGSTVAIVDY